jgi:ribosome biogenesis protein Nip4
MKPKTSVQCGSCVYLNRERIFEVKCHKLGKLETSPACSRYKSEVTYIDCEEDVNKHKVLASIMDGMNASQLQALSALIGEEVKTRKRKFKYFQLMYINIHASKTPYLSHFMECRVLDADKTRVRLISESGKTQISIYYNDFDHTLGLGISLFTAEQFREIRRELVLQKRYNDPNQFKQVKPKTLGVLPADWAKEKGLIPDDMLYTERKGKTKSKRKQDLVTIFKNPTFRTSNKSAKTKFNWGDE